MSKTLYLFVTSLRPDAYINSIVHCFQKKKITKAVLLYIDEGSDLDKDASMAQEANLHIHALLEALVDGYYKERPKKSNSTSSKDDTQEDTMLREEYGDRITEIMHLYDDCRRKVVIGPYADGKDIPYAELRKRLEQIYNDDPESIFDVTAVGKEKLGDIFAVFLTLGINNLHHFKIEPRMDFQNPWRNLIHNFRENETYRYVNLLETPIYRECSNLIKVYSEKELKVPAEDFNQAVKKNEIQLNALQQNESSRQSAARLFLIVAIVAMLVCLVLIVFFFLSWSQSWGKETGILSASLSSIAGFISAVFFRQLNKANSRADDFADEIKRHQKIQAEIEFVESIADPIEKDKLKSEIIRKFSQV